MQSSIIKGAALAVATLGLAGPAGAQSIGHVVSVQTFRPIYRAIKPQCSEGQTAERWYQQGRDGWDTMQGRTEDIALCAALAARAGYVPAETLLGRIYVHSRGHYGFNAPPPFRDDEAALYWFSKAADGGDGRAALETGQLYEMGIGAPQDDAKAIQWYQRAVTLGAGEARNHLAHLASRPQRIAAFEARYKTRADAGDGAAMFAMANAYLQADPYAPNDALAADWLTRAACAGYAPAQARLGLLGLSGQGGVKRDAATAYDWLIKASAGGDHDGDPQLLLAYQEDTLSPAQRTAVQQLATQGKMRNGIGQTVHFNPAKAVIDNAIPGQDTGDDDKAPPESLDSLARKAEAGDNDARTLLGIRYMAGDGVAKDPAAARSWLEKAADQSADAAMNLGDMAYTGEGGAADPAAAANWYAQAAVLGDSLGAKNAEAIWAKAGTAAYDPLKAYAMVLQLQFRSPNEANPLFDKLRPSTAPEARADALIWLCRLRLAHAEGMP